MDGELVSNSPSDTLSDDARGKADGPAPLVRHEDTFRKLFPYYLSIGMSEAQYWDGDCELVVSFREAEKLRQERFNTEAWLQGMYIYDAFARIAPVLHAFAKKGTKARPYLEEPYPLTQKHAEDAKQRHEKKQSNKGLQYMRKLVASNNKRFEERK